MSDIEKTLQALRDAVSLAPGNFGLTEHYVKTLLDLTRYQEAEDFLSETIANQPKSSQLQLLMAEVFYRASKNSHALAIVETLSDADPPLAGAMVLQAKLLYRAGDVESAVYKYKAAIEIDEDSADGEFASLLGIVTADSWGSAESSDEVVDGRIRQAVSEPDDNQDQYIEKPTIKFEQVGGMESVKEQIRVKIIYPITLSLIHI